MRLQYDVVHSQQRSRNTRFVNEDVEPGTCDAPCLQRLDQVLFVDEPAACDVDQNAFFAERVENGALMIPSALSAAAASISASLSLASCFRSATNV